MASKNIKDSGKSSESKLEKAAERLEKSFDAKSEKLEKYFDSKSERLEKSLESRAERLEKLFDVKSDGFRRAVINWLRTSQFFDGMVNTPARILISTMSFLALYVWGFIVFESEENFIPWLITLLVLLGMQAASVRFVFNAGGVADEFQLTRRDAAYRKAYRALRLIPALFAVVIVVLMAISRSDARYWWSVLSYGLDDHRSFTIVVFAMAVVSFQKYFSYGMKGEPFTFREKNKIKD